MISSIIKHTTPKKRVIFANMKYRYPETIERLNLIGVRIDKINQQAEGIKRQVSVLGRKETQANAVPQ